MTKEEQKRIEDQMPAKNVDWVATELLPAEQAKEPVKLRVPTHGANNPPIMSEAQLNAFENAWRLAKLARTKPKKKWWQWW